MKVIILCGGKGNKIFPFNSKWQKSCLPVGNIPNVVRIIEQCQRLGLTDISVLTDYRNRQVKYLLKDYENVEILDTKADNLHRDIAYTIGNQDVLIHYGDVYASDEDIKNVLDAFKEKGNAILVNDYKRSCDHICAKLVDGYIQSIYGHPREHYVNVKISGIFALENSMKKYIRNCPETFISIPVGGMPNEQFYLEQCLMNAIEEDVKVQGIKAVQSVVDMDFPWDILFANEKYCLEEVGTLTENKIDETNRISPNAIIKGYVHLGKNSVIGDNVIILGNCVIGDDVVIENGAIIEENCIIGDRSVVSGNCKIAANTVIGKFGRIGFTAEVCGVIFDRVSIVHHSEVYGVIGTSTDIAAGCQCAIVRFDDLENPNRVQNKEYSNKFSNAVFIGDYTRTGIGNIFLPGVKVGSNCALGPGLMIQKDVADHKLLFAKQEIIEKDWFDRYGW